MHNSAEGGGGGENQIGRESEKVRKIFAVDLVNITLGRVSLYLLIFLPGNFASVHQVPEDKITSYCLLICDYCLFQVRAVCPLPANLHPRAAPALRRQTPQTQH